MVEQSGAPVTPADPTKFSENAARIAERSQRVLAALGKLQADPTVGDPFHIAHAFFEAMTRLLADPNRTLESQVQLWQQYAQLWSRPLNGSGDGTASSAPAGRRGDRRFRHAA